MKYKYVFISVIVVLIGISLQVKMTENQKYCDQFSGESDKNYPSDNFLRCKSDSACTVEKAGSLSGKVTDADAFTFMCVPIDNNSNASKTQNSNNFPD